MLKKILILVLSLALIFSFAACDSSEPEVQETPTPEATATPEPIVYMTEDKLGTSELTYKDLIKEAKNIVNKKIQRADESKPADAGAEAGVMIGKIHLLTDTAPVDFNVLGYKYTDAEKTSYIEGTYKEYEGIANSIKFSKVVLTYKFACETDTFAVDCMKRDIKALCTFADVTEDTITLTDTDYEGLAACGAPQTVAITEDVSAVIGCTKVNDVLYYSIEITIL